VLPGHRRIHRLTACAPRPPGTTYWPHQWSPPMLSNSRAAWPGSSPMLAPTVSTSSLSIWTPPPSSEFNHFFLRKSCICTLWFSLNMEEILTLAKDPACLCAARHGDLLLAPEQESIRRCDRLPTEFPRRPLLGILVKRGNSPGSRAEDHCQRS
jgi:hypothetical protein